MEPGRNLGVSWTSDTSKTTLPPLLTSSKQDRGDGLTHHMLPFFVPSRIGLCIYSLVSFFQKNACEGIESISCHLVWAWLSRNVPGSCFPAPSEMTFKSVLFRCNLLTSGLAGHPQSGRNPSHRQPCPSPLPRKSEALLLNRICGVPLQLPVDNQQL